MKKLTSILAAAFLVTIASCSDQSQKTEPKKSGKLVSVLEFKGNGKMQSDVFHLSGNTAAIIYKYAADNPYTGNFNIYVMKKGDDINTVGGFPVVSSSKLKEDEGKSTLTKEEGDYYLLVNSNCNFYINVGDMQ